MADRLQHLSLFPTRITLGSGFSWNHSNTIALLTEPKCQFPAWAAK